MQSQNIPKTEISWTSCTVQSFTECPGMGGEIRELTVLAAKLSAGGRRVFLVPYGASDALGAMGYALAAEEIVSERADVKWIVRGSGSGRTQAGLLVGWLAAGWIATQQGLHAATKPASKTSGNVASVP